MIESRKNNVILTSSFNVVAKELQDKGLLPIDKLSVAFIPIAGDPYKNKTWIEADRNSLLELGYNVFDIDLVEKQDEFLKKKLELADIIFVAGGNTTFLNERSRLSGFHEIVRDLLRHGKLYIGSSAGSILAGPSVVPFIEEELLDLPTDFFISNPACLGLVDYIVLPHYPKHADDNEKIFEQYKNKFVFVKLTDYEYRTELV